MQARSESSRSPLLRPDPEARPQLIQIRDDLVKRIQEAESYRWLGKAEGLKASLAGTNAKLAEMDQITVRGTTNLGMTTFTHAAGFSPMRQAASASTLTEN